MTIPVFATFNFVVATAAVMGALYGIFISPFWSEPVEFGQVLAGTVRYENNNPWYNTVVDTPSLQITFPALLLLAGFDAWHLSLAASAVFSGVAFTAIASAAFVLSRHAGLSIAVPFLMLTYRFVDFHGYPVMFPVSYFQMGQTGLYLALLALSFSANSRPITAGIMGGLLIGVHAVWGCAFVIGAISVSAWLRPKQLPSLTAAFALAVVIVIGMQAFATQVLPAKLEIKISAPPSDISQNDAEQMFAAHEAVIKISAAVPDVAGKAPQKTTRGTFLAHNVLFSDSPTPLQTALRFLVPEMCFLALALAFFAVGACAPVGGGLDGADRLILMAAVPMAVALGFKFFEEYDPNFHWVGSIDHRLPQLLLRAIVTRWLNLSTVLVPIMTLAILVVLARRQSWIAAMALALLLAFACLRRDWFLMPGTMTDISFPGWTLVGWIFLLAAILTLLFKFRRRAIFPNHVVGGAVAFVLVVKLTTLTAEASMQRRFTGSDGADPLVAVVKADSGTLLISPEIVSVRGFNPQLRTGRPIMVPMTMAAYDAETRTVIQVFCYTDPYLPFAKFYADIRPCFENRPASEWAAVRRAINTTGLITPDTWRLQIPPVISAGGFSYYRLPDVTH